MINVCCYTISKFLTYIEVILENTLQFSWISYPPHIHINKPSGTHLQINDEIVLNAPLDKIKY